MIDSTPAGWLRIRQHLEGTPGLPVALAHHSSAEGAYFALAAGEADLVLLSCAPPDAERGMEGLQALRGEFAHLPIVAWLAPGDEEARREALARGADECFAPGGGREISGVLHDSVARAHARHRLAWGMRLEDRLLPQGQDPQYRAFFEHSPVGASVVDGSGKVAVSNPAFQQMLGYTAEELQHLTIADLTHPDDLEHDTTLFLEVLAGKRDSYQVEKRFIRKDGESLWTCLTVYVERDEHGRPQCGFGTIEDVTERKRAEEALRESQQQLLQFQKMEAVGRLTGGVAHDFNNLLMVIRGSVQLLLLEHQKEELAEDLREIDLAAARAQRLVEQLMAFSRRQVLRPEVLDLNAVVGDMDAMLRRALGMQVEIDRALAPTLGRVRADQGQLEQVLLNLAVNARDAMPEGGCLRIVTRDVAIDEASAAVCSHLPAGTPAVLLAVSDTGCGMDASTLERIWEPFFTTKEVGKGTGLGLSTVYGIVRQSGGWIWADSEPGKGTTFRIYLPRVEEPVDPPRRHTPAAASLPAGAGTVLVADDEPSIRKIVGRVLRQAGYTVLEGSSGEEALAVARSHPGTIDLLLTDVVMPGMGGLALARELLEARPGVPVIYMSGYTPDEAFRVGPPEPAGAFLQKPLGASDLLRKVREALGAGSRREVPR